MAVVDFAARRPVTRFARSLQQMVTLACKACERQWNAPHPAPLHQQGIDVTSWHCPFCHSDQLGMVEGSERAAPPRG